TKSQPARRLNVALAVVSHRILGRFYPRKNPNDCPLRSQGLHKMVFSRLLYRYTGFEFCHARFPLWARRRIIDFAAVLFLSHSRQISQPGAASPWSGNDEPRSYDSPGPVMGG